MSPKHFSYFPKSRVNFVFYTKLKFCYYVGFSFHKVSTVKNVVLRNQSPRHSLPFALSIVWRVTFCRLFSKWHKININFDQNHEKIIKYLYKIA